MELVPPSSKHTHTIINLHGRDGNAKHHHLDCSEVETSDSRTLEDVFPGVKWVYLTAKMIPSKRFGMDLSQFFDMWRTEDPYERGENQIQDLMASAETIKQIVLEEAKEIGSENVILCGISQGAATAITALMGLKIEIGGFIGFSTWLPPYTRHLQPMASIKKIPVLLEHCSDDVVIDIKYGQALREHLESLGMKVTWGEYEVGGHFINEPMGVDDVVRFLVKIMG